ncbi:MAG: hypothetical protein EP343_34770 [Deltaproteobacteria bacterium]|nr:MAG: hypothetical protein EP343_34770 [Deltaproteobacteria bacterium]
MQPRLLLFFISLFGFLACSGCSCGTFKDKILFTDVGVQSTTITLPKRSTLEFAAEVDVSYSEDLHNDVAFVFKIEISQNNKPVKSISCAPLQCSSTSGWGVLDGCHDDSQGNSSNFEPGKCRKRFLCEMKNCYSKVPLSGNVTIKASLELDDPDMLPDINLQQMDLLIYYKDAPNE